MTGRGIALGTVALLVLWSITQGGDDHASSDSKKPRTSISASADETGRSTGEPSLAPTSEPEIEMQDLAGLTRTEARAWTKQAGLSIGTIEERWSRSPDGVVLAQSIAPGASAAGVVDLVVSRQMPRVPLLVGRLRPAAVDLLREAGLRVAIRTITRTTGRDGLVLRQDRPRGAFVRPRTVVHLTVVNVVRPSPTNCTTGYSPCLAPASDYDCAGGSGDGPAYADGPVYVTGLDPYDLDNDGDGVACE